MRVWLARFTGIGSSPTSSGLIATTVRGRCGLPTFRCILLAVLAALVSTALVSAATIIFSNKTHRHPKKVSLLKMLEHSLHKYFIFIGEVLHPESLVLELHTSSLMR